MPLSGDRLVTGRRSWHFSPGASSSLGSSLPGGYKTRSLRERWKFSSPACATMAIHTLLLTLVTALAGAQAVTVYGQGGQQPIGTSTGTSTATSAIPSSTLAAYDTLVLNPPPLPDPLPPNQFGVQLAADAVNVNGLSIPQSGAFFGFSVEMSVVTQVSKCRTQFIPCVLRDGRRSSPSQVGCISVRIQLATVVIVPCCRKLSWMRRLCAHLIAHVLLLRQVC